MGSLILILFILVIWQFTEVSGLKTTLERLEAKLFDAKEMIGTLSARIQHLESGRVTRPPVATAEPTPAAPPVVEPPPIRRAPESASAPALPPILRPHVATPPAATMALPPVVPIEQPAPQPLLAPAKREGAESWEMVVGTSWLNKIGVLVSIVGVALLVSYSFAHIGPAGRVAIGYALSFAMLAGGMALETRTPFRNYAYGLIAGGWAGIYFTTFAMHDVAAAKIIDSDLLAVALLSIVAAGMIAHSLRYKSQVVTSLAFVVAYTTLALSPLSGFALAASVPLAVAMLVVAQYFGWSNVAVLGIASAYGTFVIRSEVFPGTGLDRNSLLPYATLGSYWLAFEVAEIAAQWRRRLARVSSHAAPVSMLALNGVGFVGSVIVTAPGDNPELFSTFLFATSAAYIASAAVRAWIAPNWRTQHGAESAFNSTHAATAAATILTAAAIGLRFHGNRETLARLLEAELLFTAGLTLGDIWLRRMASIAVLVAAASGWLRAITVGAGTGHLAFLPHTPATTSVVLAAIALAAYGNREALHRRGERLVWMESLFTWTASLLVATALQFEFTPTHEAIALLALAFVLLEAGFRRTSEYVYQAYLAGLIGSYAVFVSFLVTPNADGIIGRWGVAPTNLDAWIVLPTAVLIAAAAAWRLATRPSDSLVPGRLLAAGSAAALATAFLVTFEWRILAPSAIAPAWALTAVALVGLGAWRRQPMLRWQGNAVVLAATIRAVGPLLDGPPASSSDTAAIAAVIAAVYIAAYWGRRALLTGDSTTPTTAESPEAAVTAMLSVIGTASLAAFKWRVLPELTVAPAWAATGFVLLALGLYRERPGQRWQGYALLGLGSIRTLGYLLDQPVAAAELAWWSAAVVGVIYASAWIGRAYAARTRAEGLLVSTMAAIGTMVFIVLQSRVLDHLQIGPAWTGTAVTLVVVGLVGRAADLRWQGYVLLAAGAFRAAQPVFGVEEPGTTAIVWLALVIGALYAMGLLVRRVARPAGAASVLNPAEGATGAIVLLGATALLAALIRQEVRPSAVTLSLGLQGLALMFTGLIARERVLRLSGLALLLVCILKLFVYDLRELEALARIMSFVMLGLSLLAISWTYTRYREQIRKFL